MADVGTTILNGSVNPEILPTKDLMFKNNNMEQKRLKGIYMI